MRPCQEFRFWARRAPTAERITAAVGALLVVVLLSWLLVPGSGPRSTNLAAAGGAAASGAAPGCPSVPAGVPGVSATQIKVAVTLTNIVGPAANSIFGIANPADQQKWYEAVIDDLNKQGGIGCRKIVPTFYPTNPTDQNELQQRCLQIVQSGAFAEVDNGSYAIYPQKHCFAQHKMPFFGGYILFRSEIDAFYPYLFNISEFDSLDKNNDGNIDASEAAAVPLR